MSSSKRRLGRSKPRRKAKPKRIAWWVTPKGKLTKREKLARRRAQKHAMARRREKLKRSKAAWMKRAMKHLNLTREQAIRLDKGQDRMTYDQARIMLGFRGVHLPPTPPFA